MTKEVAVSIFEKEVNCFCTHPSNCSFKACLGCESYVEDDDLHEAMRVAVDILKNREERIRYLETQLAKELYSKGLSIEDISNWLEMSDTTVRKIVEENKS